ncbi:OmpA family protein [Zestomonas carbonaria]|uniref:Outer membrane porin F n=1 Tax=Zestomonas carbonaria TaxID=2762745 RepID=A0A7U7IAJ0_9GAMM|nr:OmpA family protein [Pseudomonas carbonaria]CAD5109271.1 Outer membrane porin F [Pseudomonas carbonaria]
MKISRHSCIGSLSILLLALSGCAGQGDKPSGEPPRICVDGDNDGVCDTADRCPLTPANLVVDTFGCPEPGLAAKGVGRNRLEVHFANDSTSVRSEDYPEIERLASRLKARPDVAVILKGYTDDRGAEAYNRKLSERRAAAVSDVLVKRYGIEKERVTAIGYGESHPVADNATSEGRDLNRRVELEFRTLDARE